MTAKNVYTLRASEAAAAREALNETRAEKLRIAYVARRTERSVNVYPALNDVTPRPTLRLPWPLWIAFALVVGVLLIVALAGCSQRESIFYHCLERADKPATVETIEACSNAANRITAENK